MSHARDLWTLWSAFFGAPRRVGAIVPSSVALAREIVGGVDWVRARRVIECGPGTGVFTRHILDRLHPSGKLVAVEIDPDLAARLRGAFPGLTVYQDSVSNLSRICRHEGIDHVDAILSSLPWASFTRAEQDKLLAALLGVLRAGGQFTTFAYLQGMLFPPGRRFRQLLRDHFSEVTQSRIVWRNLPPAFVYRCRR